MTTREVYFKAYMVSDKQQGMLYYTHLQDGLELVKPTGWLDLCPEWHERNINYLQQLEQVPGFMFWNISDECDLWLEQKSDKHKEVVSALAFVQREKPVRNYS